MSESLVRTKPLGLFARLHAASPGREDLQNAAQLAIRVEFTTIPAYLTALYSITETDSNAYQSLRSVVMEEMFHVNQAANILVALGGKPSFTGASAPTYPGYLPEANPKTTPYIGLSPASISVFGNTFAGIETPAPAGAPPQGENYDSIAQLYAALLAGVAAYNGNPFEPAAPGARQRTDMYLGKFGGTVLHVTDKESAAAAVQQIVRQGEGAVPPDRPLRQEEKYGAYQHYGTRTDGTYGPILGRPLELSHFVKFRNVANDPTNFPSVLPVTSNPRIEDFSNPVAVDKANLFNQAYSVMLRALERCFQDPTPQDPTDPYFGVVLNIMHAVLPHLARTLMNTPTTANGDSAVGPNAAPTWTYVPDGGLKKLVDDIEAVIKTVTGTEELGTLQKALKGAQLLTAVAAELAL